MENKNNTVEMESKQNIQERCQKIKPKLTIANNKISISTIVSVFTLNINSLNSPIKGSGVTGWIFF